jgi:threonine dehydratase
MIHEAADRIRPIAQRTPVLTSHSFDTVSGVNAFFKCEQGYSSELSGQITFP